MNILYHHRTKGRGVEGVHIDETVKALISLDNCIDMVSPAGINQANLDKSTKPNKAHLFISKFLPEIFFETLEILYNFVASKRIYQLLKEKKYDLIYERYAIFNWAGVRLAKRHKIPIILEINYTSFTPIYRKRSALLKPLAHWLDKRIFKKANGLIVVSTYLKNHLIDLGVDEKKIIVLTNAADPVKFNPTIEGGRVKAKYGLSDNKVIGFMGGFYPWHGLDMLISCFKDVKEGMADSMLLLIGEGPCKDSLLSMVYSLKMEKDVIFLDQVQHNELPEYIAAFDVAVMPDSNSYGSPMKIYEYMAMGKPVVAPCLGPLQDGITDGKEGILFAQRDTRELTKALKTLLVDKELSDKMGHSARENILSKHTWRKNAESILELYSKINSPRSTVHGPRLKILFITPRIPYPPFKGDMLRPYNFIKELSKKHEIDLCTFCENGNESNGIAEMKKYCSRVETVVLTKKQSYLNVLRSLISFRPLQVSYYYSKRMERKIMELFDANKYDIIHIVLQRMMLYAKRYNGERIVLDQIDALSLNMRRRAATETNFIKKAVFYYEYMSMARYERDSRQRYDACVVTSEVDKRALGDEMIEVVPNGVDTSYFVPGDRVKNIDLVFTGNMGYFPNVDAAVYLCKEILPKILEEFPTLRLYIVGARPSKEVRVLADNKNIFVTGFVDDIREYYSRARIFVAPLRSGSGIQNKILEAMACGLPVVTTLQGNAGIKAEDKKHLIVVDDPAEFAGSIINLLTNEDRRQSLGNNARGLVEKEFDWAARAERLGAIYETICS